MSVVVASRTSQMEWDWATLVCAIMTTQVTTTTTTIQQEFPFFATHNCALSIRLRASHKSSSKFIQHALFTRVVVMIVMKKRAEKKYEKRQTHCILIDDLRLLGYVCQWLSCNVYRWYMNGNLTSNVNIFSALFRRRRRRLDINTHSVHTRTATIVVGVWNYRRGWLCLWPVYTQKILFSGGLIAPPSIFDLNSTHTIVWLWRLWRNFLIWYRRKSGNIRIISRTTMIWCAEEKKAERKRLKWNKRSDCARKSAVVEKFTWKCLLYFVPQEGC